MPTSQVYALKGHAEYAGAVHSSLLAGVGRFGWSCVEGGDLLRLKPIIEEGGWDVLTVEEKDSWQPFLLDLRPDDWVIYVNVPEWGRCTLARVTGPYFWLWDDDDFNHRFRVDPSSVHDFDRNDARVQPALSARLKLQGRYWRIYAETEFLALRAALEAGVAPAPRTPETNAALLGRELEPLLRGVTQTVQRTHPNYDLEALVGSVFERVPGVRRVTRQGGAGDNGADLLVEYESGLPVPALQSQHLCVVQVKSFVGAHSDLGAVKDIRRAFVMYPNADMGLIVSTADASTPAFDEAIVSLREETGKRVELLIGADVARFLLRFGQLVLG